MKRQSLPLLLILLLVPLAFAASEDAADRTTGLQGRESGARYLPDGESPVFSKAFKENIEYRVSKNMITGIVVGVVTPRGTSFFSCGV